MLRQPKRHPQQMHQPVKSNHLVSDSQLRLIWEEEKKRKKKCSSCSILVTLFFFYFIRFGYNVFYFGALKMAKGIKGSISMYLRFNNNIAILNLVTSEYLTMFAFYFWLACIFIWWEFQQLTLNERPISLSAITIHAIHESNSRYLLISIANEVLETLQRFNNLSM